MADLRVSFQGLEAEAETALRDNLLTWLRDLGEYVLHADFQGSGNGAPNFSTDDVKSTSSAGATPVDAPPTQGEASTESTPAGVQGGPPIPVAAGIDPSTLGAPAQSPS